MVDQVNRSFAPASTTATNASTSQTSSSRASSPTSPVHSPSPRRSTSALLLTLLSPLLPGTQPALPRAQANDPQHVSRMHRRQARSLLVDAYRQFVLPQLKSALPTAYLPWAIAGEVTQRTAEYEGVKLEINSILASTGYDASTRQAHTPTKRARALTSSTASSSEGSDSESEFIETPMTSAQSSRCSSPLSRMLTASPHSFILSIPPAHELPSAYRSTYSHRLADLTRIASRLSAIKKLDMQYEREEQKRKWLENIERGKAGERALRRAWSSGESQCKGVSSYAKPVRSSPLWRSWTAEDEERSAKLALAMPIPTHPAMMDDDSDSVSDSDSGSSDDLCLVTPPHHVSYGPLGRRDSMTPPTPVRPALIARKALPVETSHDEDSSLGLEHLTAPPLMPSKSDDSLPEVDEWDRDSSSSSSDDNDLKLVERVAIVDTPSKAGTWARPPTAATPSSGKPSVASFKSKIVNWARLEPDEQPSDLPLVF